MAVPPQYQPDVDAILARRHDNGADHWATSDGRLIKGSPFTTLDCALMLRELGVAPDEPVLRETAALILNTWRDDGRFRLAPGAIYPCHTIHAARTLARLGYGDDERLARTFAHLLAIRHDDGGWRCAKFSYGHGPETESSNPGPTLAALDAFRLTPPAADGALDDAVGLLLRHWETRAPLGPCHYGIGTLFVQVAYPFAAYNLFFWVYVLSFYERARTDPRFLDALRLLESKTAGGQVVVERPNPRLAGLAFCRKGERSDLATARYREILANLGAA
jgi:hypothetical protein